MRVRCGHALRRGPKSTATIGYAERVPAAAGWAVGPITWAKKGPFTWADVINKMALEHITMVVALKTRDIAERKTTRSAIVDAAHMQLVGLRSMWDPDTNYILFEDNGAGYTPPAFSRRRVVADPTPSHVADDGAH